MLSGCLLHAGPGLRQLLRQSGGGGLFGVSQLKVLSVCSL